MADLVLSGNTSGAITISAPSVAGTNTLTLPASTGTVLTTGSPQSGGVIQSANGVLTSNFSTSSLSYVDTGLTASITPKFSTSKILVLVSINGLSQSAGNVGCYNLLRNGSTVVNNTGGGEAQTFGSWATAGGISSNRMMDSATITYLDSPATTSALTYKVQMRQDSGGTGTMNAWQLNSDAGCVSTITLLEIAA